MTESTISPVYVYLYDLVPGPIRYELPPADSSGDVFGNASHCNVSSAVYPLGTKVGYWDATNQGWSILTYLRFQDCGDTTPAVADVCAPVETTTIIWYDVTQEGDSFTNAPYVAIACAAMTDNYFGWFWTGGVCPSGKAPDLAAATTSIHTAVDDVAGGDPLVLADCATANQLGFDGLHSGDTLLLQSIVGYALHADA